MKKNMSSFQYSLEDRIQALPYTRAFKDEALKKIVRETSTQQLIDFRKSFLFNGPVGCISGLEIEHWEDIRRTLSLPTIPLVEDAGDLRDGRYLVIEIDLAAPLKEKIMPNFLKIAGHYKKYVKISLPKKKQRTIYDPWEIYRLHHENGMGFRAIARKKIREHKKTASSAEVDTAEKRVKRSYERATEIISALEHDFKEGVPGILYLK